MRIAAMTLALALAAPALAQDMTEIEKPASHLEQILSETVQMPEGAQEVRVINAIIDPHTAAGWHTHPTPVYIYVVEGELTLEVENKETRTVAAGEALAEPLDAPMRAVNAGDVPAKLVVFQISPSDKEFLEQKSE